MQQVLDYIRTHATMDNLLLLLAAVGTLSLSCTAIGNVLKKLAPQDSKLYHIGDAILGLGQDLAKVKAAGERIAELRNGDVNGPIVKALAAIAVAGALLLPAHARAQGFKYGPSVSILEIRPGLSSPIALAPGAGLELSYEWKRWSAGLALYGNALQLIGGTGQSTSEVSAVPLACWKTPGVCLGPVVVLAGPDGGLIKGFTWKRSVGLAFSASGDLLSWFTALGAVVPGVAPSAGAQSAALSPTAESDRAPP